MTLFDPANIRGAGIGLRTKHYQDILAKTSPFENDILEGRPAVPWFEVLTDNYLGDGGQPLAYLDQVRQHYPITLHGVGMSLGSTDPLNLDYLRKLRRLADRVEPAWVSDHLAWTSHGGRHLHELMPLPYTREALLHVGGRIRQAQDFLGRRLVVENPSSYLQYRMNEMTEWEFLDELVARADCDLLMDVNNIFVSARNHGYDPRAYLRAIPAERVREIHLAGYEELPDYLFDTHGYRVRPPVWDLYREALELWGPVPTLIEWDNDIPDFQILLDEASRAQRCLDAPGPAREPCQEAI